jgi:polyisoprenoid-binding protein YceI
VAWILDRAHTEVAFAVRQLVVSTVRGHFREFDAQIDLDLDHPARSSVRATIEVASVDTGNALRDAHLRTGDFFDVAAFPRITFESTHVGQVGQDSFWITGNLAIHGVAREVTLRGQFQGTVAELVGAPALHFTMTAEIDREDFGMSWGVPLDSGGLLVGNLVTVTIRAELLRAPASGGDPAALPVTNHEAP